MQAANHPPINLISEKVAFQGVTRFDDRYRLPLGISVNMAAFSATLMAEVSFQPKILLPYLHLGLENEMAIQDVRPCLQAQSPPPPYKINVKRIREERAQTAWFGTG